jgi:hypothetical protein
VDLKYVLSTQVIQIQYESRNRFFSVATVSTRTPNAGDSGAKLSERLGALSMDDDTHIYIIDWDTSVAIEDSLQVSEPKPQAVRSFSSLHVFFRLTMRNSSMLGFRNNPRALMPMRPLVV